MKQVLAALFVLVASLFATVAKADTLQDGFSMHIDDVTSDEGTSYRTTLYVAGHADQVVWSGPGLVLAVTPKTLVVDQLEVAHSHAFHNTVVYRWNGSKFVAATPVAGFSMHVEQHRLPQGVVFTTILSFPGYSQTKEVSGIVQDISRGILTSDEVTVTAKGETHSVVRLSMGHW